jgi:hypothetical protein
VRPLLVEEEPAGGLWIARRALRPVSLMVGQGREITQRGFRRMAPKVV